MCIRDRRSAEGSAWSGPRLPRGRGRPPPTEGCLAEARMRSWSRRNSLLDSGRGRMRGRFAAVGHRPLHSGVPLAHSEPDDATARRAAAAGGARTCTTEEFSPLLKVFDLEQVRLVDFHPIHPLPGTSAGLDGRLPGVDAVSYTHLDVYKRQCTHMHHRGVQSAPQGLRSRAGPSR